MAIYVLSRCLYGNENRVQRAIKMITDKRYEVYVHPHWVRFFTEFLHEKLEICFTCKHCQQTHAWRGDCSKSENGECYYMKKCDQYERKEN